MDAAAGPGVRMEVDLATVREVIKGYEHEISELIKAEMGIRIGLNIDQPGEEEASGTYTNGHYAPAESLREALRSQRDALQARHDNLVAVVWQYERTEVVNKSDLRRHPWMGRRRLCAALIGGVVALATISCSTDVNGRPRGSAASPAGGDGSARSPEHGAPRVRDPLNAAPFLKIALLRAHRKASRRALWRC